MFSFISVKRFIKLRKEASFGAAFAVVVAAGLIYLQAMGGVVSASMPAATDEAFALPVNKKIIVIDAGHGGWDPGMIGVKGTVEKEINLAIAEKTQSYLELGGAVVLVTRGDDSALSESKRKDLDERRKLADSADIMVSIHQNSFPSAKVRGAQVFYYEGSKVSQSLAESIQRQFGSYLDTENERLAKSNSAYYVLKKTQVPSVIVECGFLSNVEEEILLNADEYQERVAWAIYIGILNYFAGIY